MVAELIQRLHSGGIMLMDGAMGTELQRAGILPAECYEGWNLTQPDRVVAIHAAYIQAGAQVLLTNTFQANPPALARHGLDDKLELICETGIALARKAANGKAFVLSSIGPCTGLTDYLRRLVWACRQADAILVETLSDPFEAGAIRDLCHGDLPVFTSYCFCRGARGDLTTWTGWTPEDLARHAENSGVACLGVNCGREIAMSDVEQIILRYRSCTRLPLFARPNAGTPSPTGAQLQFPEEAETMSQGLAKVIRAGANMIGGCCGTTPGHIAAFRNAIQMMDLKN